MTENQLLHDIWPEWKIIRQIGRGSYGTVYEAVRTDHGVESKSAIKVISVPQDRSELDSLRSEGMTIDGTKTYLQEIVNDFVREIQIMESFKGVQNIVSVEDYKVVEKVNSIGWDIVIRMELLTPFCSYIANQTMSEREVIKLGCDICTALERCAQYHVIHRDIKPENIFVNAFGDFKLGDFGIARRLDRVNMELSQKGTYHYMAPEIKENKDYDATVDLYSLGLVLYKLLNHNKLPFLDPEKTSFHPDERVEAVQRRMRGEPIPAPCNASEATSDVILMACAYDPKQRFESASAMKQALMAADKELDSIDDGDKTISVRHAKKQESESEGSGHESKIPKIVMIAAVFIVLSIIGIVAVPHLFQDNDDKEEISTTAEEKVTTATTDTEATTTSETEVTTTASATETTTASDPYSDDSNDGPITTGIDPFYGIWCGASKDLEKAQSIAEDLNEKGFDGKVFVSTDWGNLNSEFWYVVSAGIYSSKEEADADLSSVQSAGYSSAYVKYSGDRLGE